MAPESDNGTQQKADGTVYVGGLMNDDTYCIIVGETSLCGKLYRRLGHRNGADFATHWDSVVQSEAEARGRAGYETTLCPECEAHDDYPFKEEVC